MGIKRFFAAISLCERGKFLSSPMIFDKLAIISLYFGEILTKYS